jgi:ADP-ribose pyrophosphatase
MSGRTKGPWTVTASRERFASELLTVVEDSVVRPDGSPGTYVVARVTAGVLVLAVDDDATTYLVRQYRYAADRETLEAAAGSVDEGETPEQAARRELEEELGITARELVDLGELFPVASLLTMRERLFLARGLTFGSHAREPSEVMTVERVPFDEAVRMAEDGRICGPSTCALLLRARPHVAGDARPGEGRERRENIREGRMRDDERDTTESEEAKTSDPGRTPGSAEGDRETVEQDLDEKLGPGAAHAEDAGGE